MIPELCEAMKKLLVIAPNNRKKPFIHMLIKNNVIKNVKKAPALEVKPIIKYAQSSNNNTK